MKAESNWINTSAEVPLNLMVVEVERGGVIVRLRYCGLDRWETLDGKQTDPPVRWRFIPAEPGSTGRFIR